MASAMAAAIALAVSLICTLRTISSGKESRVSAVRC